MHNINLRIIDANFNRTRESLRVLEDIIRFYFNDKTLTLKLKKFRAQISRAFIRFPLLESRDVINDTGKYLNTHKEFQRDTLLDIIIANTKRLQESIRVL